MNSIQAAKITCCVYKETSPTIIKCMQSMGITSYSVQAGRSVVMRKRDKGWFSAAKTILEEDPIDVFYMYVSPEINDQVFNTISLNAGLDKPGTGSIYSQKVRLIHNGALNIPAKIDSAAAKPDDVSFLSNLIGICIILQRGQGNELAAAALNMGTTVPIVTFGEGTGLRDKIGLLRITFSAQKEIVNLVINDHDADEIVNLLINAGRLDQPGKGFIYTYPVDKGLVNTKILRGKQQYAASMEQIITTIDGMMGDTLWRQRLARPDRDERGSKRLKDQIAMRFLCNEGQVINFVNVAMAAGASGATIGKQRVGRIAALKSGLSLAREIADMIVGKDQVEDIVESLTEAGAFSDISYGVLEIHDVPEACTYLGG
ncbi:MAG: P-II family nitrogen regulator [Syntrophomonadaceae bacterium]|nr:P-II family nitrogen regulator [Syntrophomonadaceae bacterium]